MIATEPAPDLALDEALAKWKETVLAELKGASIEKKLVTRVAADIAIQPLYTRADLTGMKNLAAGPGAPPFLRGSRPRRAGRFWQIAQEIAPSSGPEYNRALLDHLQRGQDAVVLRPAEVSWAGALRSGVRLNCVDDFSVALREVDIRAVPVHLPAGADPRALAALYLALAQDRGVPFANLTGSVTSDPLGRAAESGRFPGNLDRHFEAMAEWTRWAAENAPSLQTIEVESAIWGDGGASASQELGLTLACAAEYLRALLARGLTLPVIAERIRFRFCIGSQFFVEVAKFRAFRPLWTRLLLAFGGSAELGATGAIFAATGRWNKTLLDSHVNLLRVTTEALSAVLGGVDGLHLAPFDEVTGQTTEFSRRIALNLHTLLAEEFGLARPADPAGGSWFVEKLTDDLGRAGWSRFQEIERQGGFSASLKQGYVQAEVEKSLMVKTSAVEARRIALVGTNLFPNLKEKISPDLPVRNKILAGPDPASSPFRERSIDSKEADFRGNLRAAIDAARNGATAAALALRFQGTSSADLPIPAVKTTRAAEGFEALRRASEHYAAQTGSRPKVFLAKIGPLAQHRARADFSAGFFSVGGFEIVASGKFDDASAAALAAIKSGAPVAVLCSTDETYPTLAPGFAQALRAAGAKIVVVLAGLPADPALLAAYRQAGFDEFIHARANVPEMLASLLRKIGTLS